MFPVRGLEGLLGGPLLVGLLRSGQLGSLIQGVAGDGQEHVQEAVVPAEGQHDEVYAVDDPSAVATAHGQDGSVHHVVPVLLR